MDAAAASGEPIALDVELSRLTADVVCRTIFSIPLESELAAAVFRDFEVFQATVANVRLGRLLLGRPFADAPQPKPARMAAARIRQAIADLLAPRRAPGAAPLDDLAGDLIAARDPETGDGFTETELIDQLAVFFLAGHETTASAVSWALVLLHGDPDYADRCRAESDAAAATDAPIAVDQTKRMRVVHNLLRESMRLYPPGPFLPRVARAAGELGGRRFRRGTMIMISPWIIHRHPAYWPDADRFDPSRFEPGSPHAGRPGAYLPFGLGPRACVGAGFATLEGATILARLLKRYFVSLTSLETIRPTAKLTIRPDAPIWGEVARR
ncbi:MAG: cytochrome P450 [Pseudomonadota bacterium]